jgi:hypothetical protein
MPFAVTCTKCGSRFALTDELYDRKVKGRIVTVRCKSCKSDISVDGVELASRPSNAPPPPDEDGTPTVPLAMPKRDEPPATSGPISRSASEHPPAPGLWVVSYAETDDRELTLLQVERALGRREIDEQTLVWRDGMDEWIPLGKVDELAEVAKRVRSDQTGGLFGTGMSVPPPKPSKSPPRPERKERETETGAFESAGAGTLFVEKAAKAPEPPKPRVKPQLPKRDPSPKPPPVAAKPALPKAPAPVKREIVPDAPEPDEEPAPVSSGTPALAALTTELKKSARGRDDDDIFTLGTGSDGPALGPPTIDLSNLTAPPPEVEVDLEPAPPSTPALKKAAREARARSEPPVPPVRRPAPVEEKRGSFVPWLVLAAAAAVAVWWFAFRPKPVALPPPEPTARPEPIATEPAPTETTTAVPPTTGSAPDEPAPVPTTTSAPTAPTATVAPTGPVPKPTETPATTAKPPEPAPTKPKEPDKEVPLAGPFDKGAASAALSAAAGRASACRKEGDPSGTATVIVTFAPSGRVTSAIVSGPPFAGTATGGCIASSMRSASVPPFSGDKVTVSKTVVIN